MLPLATRYPLPAALLLVAALLAAAQPPDVPAPQEKWFTQRLDHLNASDTRTFRQRYLLYTEEYRAGGPLFFTAGGESDVYGGYRHNGLQFELAKQLHAMILYVEHRFYGESLPYGPVGSYVRGVIEKLTVEQAMADNVAVIAHVKAARNLPDYTPVIAWGGSYAGELVSYMRAAYPHDIHAAVAGSAPLRYYPGSEVPSGAYFEAATRVFDGSDARCSGLVRAAFSEMLGRSATPEGRAWVAAELGLCEPLEALAGGLRTVALWAENAYAQLAMLDYPWPNVWVGLPPYPIDAACAAMLRDDDDGDGEGLEGNATSLTRRLGRSVGTLYNATGALRCFNVSDEYYTCADITGCGGGVGDPNAMSWDYQSCTEVVAGADTNNVTDMFPPAPFDAEALREYCQRTWGAEPTPTRLHDRYHYELSTRIIHSNGRLDPWWVGGVLNVSASLDQHAIVYNKGAHHLDFYGSDPVHDPPEVVAARELERQIITRWAREIKEELRGGRRTSLGAVIAIAVSGAAVVVGIVALLVAISRSACCPARSQYEQL
eukprot:m51a1_g5304 putative C-tail anchored protein, serine protease domain (545) ;mRNA; r:262506-265085